MRNAWTHAVQRATLCRTLGCALLLSAALAQAQGGADAGTAKPSPPATVTYDGEPILTFHTRVYGYTPAARADDITERLHGILSSPLFRAEDVSVENHDDVTMLYWRGEFLFALTDDDAASADTTRPKLAAQVVAAMGVAVEHAAAARTPKSLLVDAAYALVTTLVLVLAILAVNWAVRRARGRLEAWFRLAGRKLHSYSTAERLAALAVALLGVLRVVVILLLLYLYIPAVFRLFPWTRSWGATLLVWAIDPVLTLGHALVGYLPNVFVIAIALLVTRGLLRLLRAAFEELGAGRIRLAGFYPEWAQPTFQLVRAFVVVMTAVVIFPYLPGAHSPAFQGVTILLGALLTFGSGSAVSNLFAGVILTYTRAFQVGDRVRVGDSYGDVIEKSLLVTRVRTIKNEEVAIPNGVVMGTHIVNFSAAARGKGLLLHTRVTIGYDAPWRKVHALLLAAARATPRILAEPAPFVWQKSLDDFFVTYELNAATAHPEVLDDTYAELHKAIRDAFDEGGVEILSPHYASLRDGSRSTVGAPDKPKPTS
ncbi:MAG: mechanosensitive ion channel family protein [Myxococcaceae bacterium]